MENGQEVVVTKKLVKDRLSDVLTSSDLSKYIL
jgi:ATP-dependent protease HslVU (ClpYQ) ATPase subunit